LENTRTAAGTVVSKDGTTIAYRTVGTGPHLIVIPGVMSTAGDYARFADALAAYFTVHTIERRGRGTSGPQGEDYGIARECEDVAALRAKTGARYLVGHSFGGLISLEAARGDTDLIKLAVYEPGVCVDGLIPTAWMPGYRKNLAAGRPLDAFAEFCVATGPRRVRKMPQWLMKLVLRLIMRSDKRRKMFRLLPANLLEHQEIARLDNTYGNYREVVAPTLVMTGGKSDLAYVPAAVDRLAEVLPVSVREEFPKLDHFGPDQKGPREVAEAVDRFFRE
jgi:pimeloyl-ACP methyl ester carboxylesterase